MIVPPFFGLHLPFKDTSVYGLKHSYLTSDVLTYSAPTNKVTLTYASADVLSYDIPDNPLTITWSAPDVLCFDKPTDKISISFCATDVLTYNPPPSLPEIPYNIVGLDGDESAFITWSPPYANRSPIIDYIIEYKTLSETSWNTYVDNISINTGITITGLINNSNYQFRIAAINAIGTGLPGLTDIITPSGGDDSYCSLKFFIKPDALDISSIQDLSSSGCSITHIGVQGDADHFKYGGRSLFFDGQLDQAPDPNQFPYFSTFHHLNITRNLGNTDQTYWSLNDNFTIEFWIRPESPLASSQTVMSVYSQENLDPYNYSFWRLYFTNGILYFNGLIDFYDSSTGEWNYQNINHPINNVFFLVNNFTHIAICRSKGYIQFFVDGLEKSKIYFPHNIKINSDHLIIGADHTRYNYYYDTYSINRVYTTNPFIGNIDDILISTSAKYRKGFIPIQHTNIGIPSNCFAPGQVTNLSIGVVDGV